MNTKLMTLCAVAVSTVALAQAPVAVVPTPGKLAPGAELKLSCPGGTKQIGGQKSALEATLCVKVGPNSTRLFHGPYVAFWPNGNKQAEGQYEDGNRGGHWVFFDEQGVKTGETNFKDDSYHGSRIEFFPTGKVKLEETYVMGKRQGPQKTYDAAGKVTVTQFQDDHPIAAK